MKLTILAVGPLKASPEKELIEDYCKRFSGLGRSLGLSGINMLSVKSGGGLNKEGDRLLAKIPDGAMVIRLDEHGEAMSSVALSRQLATWRDDGRREICFLIGGAEGYAQAVKDEARKQIAFGPQTWPHMLVRVMLTEQIYRAASILAGTPYHKA